MATMQRADLSNVQNVEAIRNGPGAAAILAAGVGSAALGTLAFAGDAWDSIGKALNFYNPVGTLSGVTTLTIVIWLVAWFVLARAWADKKVNASKVNVAAFAMLIVGFLLTFPPFMDLLQGK